MEVLMLEFNKASLTSPELIPLNPANSFDTVTGHKTCVPSGATIVSQSKEVAFYVMQTLRMNSNDVLTFFDSGANGNLICGDVADAADFMVVDPGPAVITVMGGGSGQHRIRSGLLHHRTRRQRTVP
jgi:hypothetical protein